MKERLIYDILIIDQSFLYGGNYEKGSYYCIYNVFIRDDFLSGSMGIFYEPVEVSLVSILFVVLIFLIIAYRLYKKKRR